MPKIVFKICPYKPSSAGAQNLKEALEELLPYSVERVTPDYRIKSNEWIINWGNGNFRAERQDDVVNTKVINSARKVCYCINKLDFFRILEDEDVVIPRWTTRSDIARKWVSEGTPVYCRGDIEGRDGRGIQIATTSKEIIPAHLYTAKIESDQEFRVHVFKHKPIFDLIKRHHKPTKENNLVRSGSNGWNYHRDITLPDIAHQEAIKTSKALGMDFCAVDILWNSKTRIATVLEANSAPELGPWTRAAYAKEFINLTK